MTIYTHHLDNGNTIEINDLDGRRFRPRSAASITRMLDLSIRDIEPAAYTVVQDGGVYLCLVGSHAFRKIGRDSEKIMILAFRARTYLTARQVVQVI
ncbi:hypothetical protein [Gluconacetobacter tumulicola]|uniref:Uncharacterized protein n=1 Tax=Gluconacetobacter tumulicola TaxID=1017177 RepID=A0A7W4P7F0_9PROT|nr:hypothetical protein [Gluconacetobacter tumulicola]MBB2180132.1 hypothetical protein [Gluconacetobacter tumulicola]